ncbi:mechanosensitive ion channel family protein [Plebeiibacterium sediminum]|uniref:Mechanosensitive ion channel family protein n=1 Tax=Plebeiibacterium sediminum TaxID=2992112 RepID=A0AAE3SFL2_9BACT|nr:mechanosensitive ion channel family protein [Plebeiobacterium sediminum]MCW3787558.1 mechanosensitive ion channel family protein [Plebeiobacterium sediminum]
MMDLYYWIKVVSIIAGVYLITFTTRKIIGLFIKRQSLKVNVDPTNFSFLKNSISFIIYTAGLIAIFYITPPLNSVAKALFASAGILAAIIGFASQKAFSNIISGIFILIFRPFRVKDVIEVGALNKGVVEEITLRHTIIRNYENRRIIIPNSIISEETIINSNIIEEKIKKFIEFDVSYESDLDLAKQIIKEEAENHPLLMDNRSEEDKSNDVPKVVIRVIRLGEYSITIRAYVWAKNNDDAFVIACDMNESVKKRFDATGIEIPYPHRTIVTKKSN